MSRKIKSIIVFFILLVVTIGVYFNQTKVTLSPLQDGYDFYQKGEYQEAVAYFKQRADDDPQSAFSLAMIYWEGVAVPEDRLIAREWLIKAANLKNKDALYNLGYLRYHDFIHSTSDDTRGLSSISKAAELGSVEAKRFLKEIESDYDREQKSTLLSLYGEQTWLEKKETIRELEALAETGNKEAIYQYLNSPDSTKRSLKTEGYIHPFVEKKDPKLMYLKYTLISKNIHLLIDSANAHYPDAVYLLYQIYHGDVEVNELREDAFLAKVYLKLSADLAHHDGLIALIKELSSNYNKQSKYFSESPEKYINKLLEVYPNSHQGMIAVANVYSDPASELYNPNKAFELLNKSYDIHPSAEVKLLIANYYAHSIGTSQDLEKAIHLLKENIENKKLLEESQYALVKLYFEFDDSNYIEKEEVVNILKEHVEHNRNRGLFPNYKLAHYYADILLEEDPVENDESAFSLYERASHYISSAKIHEAIARIKYKNEIDEDVFRLIIDDLRSDLEYYSLTEKERKEGYDILLKQGMNADIVTNFLFERAFFDEKIKIAIQPTLRENKDILFKYITKNIIYESTRDHLNKDNLKKYYKDIFELAESGYTEAMKFIIKKEIEIESIFSSPFYDYHFDELTHITKNERNAWRERCAALGDEICLKDLSIINKPINKYDEDSTVPSKLKYYEWNERDNIKLDNYVNDLKKKDDNKSLLLLSEFYFNKDSEKSLFYADKAYKLGVSQASQYIYQYYFENRCEDKNNINEAKRYFKEWLALSKSKNSEFTYNYIKEIGDYHLNPPCSMERDLDEAIEWYLLSFSYPYGIDSSMYTQLNNLYTNEVDNNDYGMYGNMYLSALKNHSDYVLSMQARLGNMSYAEPSFLGLYEAYLLKGDIKEAYFYASLLNVNVSNVAMFHLLSESERNEIDTKIDEYINQNK